MVVGILQDTGDHTTLIRHAHAFFGTQLLQRLGKIRHDLPPHSIHSPTDLAKNTLHDKRRGSLAVGTGIIGRPFGDLFEIELAVKPDRRPVAGLALETHAFAASLPEAGSASWRERGCSSV